MNSRKRRKLNKIVNCSHFKYIGNYWNGFDDYCRLKKCYCDGICKHFSINLIDVHNAHIEDKIDKKMRMNENMRKKYSLEHLEKYLKAFDYE